ncbi:hypothetical protein H6G83_31210 [Anabaena azotica FACHB-119]|uniref:Uncharacterized protein n=2 Tax=Anabaena azotica TaxID=197653 RepID=A0ABR8DCQ6_9NOST|nr:hypothetical protein [Anabaena azotica]MBD2505020.1 hypothetical protein [Anabaena azotica FACHB-119]
MKPMIKKSDLRIIKKTTAPQSPLPPVEPADDIDDFVDAVSPSFDEQPDLTPQTSATDSYKPHTPVADYPLVRSVGNSGWQVSDIWRDLRVDAFCD